MLHRWTGQLPQLRGHVTTLREIDAGDVYPLFTLFSDPAVTTFMAPPPPTLAKFAGFIEWSHQQRAHGLGVCFVIVPDGMAAPVGILQVRRLEGTITGLEWGFVLSTHFWSTGVFADSANALAEHAFASMQVDRLEARIALRNRRAQAAVKKIGAQFETLLESNAPHGIARDPESVWALSPVNWRNRPRDFASADYTTVRIRAAIDAVERQLSRSEAPEGVEPYPLFLFDRRRKE